VTVSADQATVPVKHTDRFFIGGQWVTPSSDSKISVIDSHSEQVYRAREVAGQIRTGAIGHNGFKSDFDVGHGGFKQSGIGREAGVDGLLPFLESKAMLLDGPTSRYRDIQL